MPNVWTHHSQIRRIANADNYCRAEEAKLKAMEARKQADAKAVSAARQTTRFKEQSESVMSARREANAAKKEADDIRDQLARSEKR